MVKLHIHYQVMLAFPFDWILDLQVSSVQYICLPVAWNGTPEVALLITEVWGLNMSESPTCR
jgi:hypothetical protein